MPDLGGGTGAPVRIGLTRVRLTPGSVAMLLGAVSLAMVVRTSFISAHRQIGWALAATVVAALLMPIVDFLDRHMPRWMALFGTMIGVGLATIVVWGGIIVNLRNGLHTLENRAPEAAKRLEDKYEVARQFRLVERVDALIAQFHQTTGTAAVSKAVGTASTYFVCGILTLFLLVYGPRMIRGGFTQIGDRRRRLRVERVTFRAMSRARGYIVAAVIQAFVVGFIVGGTAWLLDLPAPFVLGALAGTVGMLPTLGIVVGGLPALLLAAGLNTGKATAVIAIMLLGLQSLEAMLVRRRVDEATVHLGPALPAIVALLGYESYGIGGAMYGAAMLVFLIAWMDTVGFDDSPAPTAEESVA
jgi:predicted PurR-regulated permease PerM